MGYFSAANHRINGFESVLENDAGNAISTQKK